jgi:transcriptional regulator
LQGGIQPLAIVHCQSSIVNRSETPQCNDSCAPCVSPLETLGGKAVSSPPKNLRESPLPQPDLDLLRGTLDLLVLRALSAGPLHGYAIAALIKSRTDDAILVEEGALYPALHRLEARRWIAATWGYSENNRRARYYSLTATGRRQLKVQTALWRRYVDAVGKVLSPHEV